MINLNGKVALITGGSRGIGAATAVRLAEQGAHIAINYLNHEAEAIDLASLARSRGGRAITIQADVSRFDDVRLLFEQTIAEFGASISWSLTPVFGRVTRLMIFRSTSGNRRSM